jgi:hypothetical protein
MSHRNHDNGSLPPGGNTGSCCRPPTWRFLVSKSCIPRTRKHFFAVVDFSTPKYLGSWKVMFPDPSTCPGHYTKTLPIDNAGIVTTADAEAGGCIRGFPCVEHFEVDFVFHQSAVPLVPPHGFSPTVKSLRVVVLALPPSQTFNSIHSFHLLEDLAVINCYETSGHGRRSIGGRSAFQQESSYNLTIPTKALR